MARQYEILNASTQPIREIHVDGRQVRLGQNGMAVVHDEGLAREIDARFGQKARTPTRGKVTVVPVDDLNPKQERGFAHYHRISGMARIRYKTIAERNAALAAKDEQ